MEKCKVLILPNSILLVCPRKFCPMHYDKKSVWGLTTRKEEIKSPFIVDMIVFWKNKTVRTNEI